MCIKSSILVVVFYLFCHQLCAQAPANGTTWYINTVNFFIGPDGGFFKLQITGDTLVAGKACKKIKGGFGCAMIPAGGILNYEGRKVFYYDTLSRKFFQLYDYGAKVGDTLTTIWHFNFLRRYDTIVSVVTDVDSFLHDGRFLAIQNTRRISKNNINDWLGITREKLGKSFFYFPQYGACDPVQFGVRCYDEPNTSIIKLVTYRCDTVFTIIGTSEILNQRTIRIFPTPSVSELNLTMDEAVDGGFSASILNTFGQIVWRSRKQIFETNLKIDINNWQSGVYHLILTDKNGEKWHRQFLKTE